MAKQTFYIVWNQHKSEGYITSDESDALYVSEGISSGGVPTVGEAFRECYADEENGEELPMQEVTIEA